MAIFRYKWVGLDDDKLSREAPGVLVLGSIGPVTFVDISAPASSKSDLDEAMATRGYVFDAQDPVDTVGAASGAEIAHGTLGGLGADDHLTYLPLSGIRSMTGNLSMGTFNIVGVGLVDGVDVSAHAARHIAGGVDELNGDQLDIDWDPTNYTPTISPSEATNLDHLTAHLAGIDSLLGTLAGSQGEDNTASNVNAGGVGTFKQKTGVDLEFRGVNAGSNKITVTLDGANNEIDIDVDESNFSIDHDDLTNVTTDQHHAKLHAADHITSGADELDGDQVDIDWSPTNYTPTISPTEVTNLDHLTAHLAGIDSEIGTISSSLGEVNTASNIGVGGVGVFVGKVGVDLQFRNINAGSSKVTITNDAANNEIDINVVDANLAPPHSNTTGQTVDDHHPQLHAADHNASGGDELTAQLLGAGALAINQIMVSDGAGGWSTEAKGVPRQELVSTQSIMSGDVALTDLLNFAPTDVNSLTLYLSGVQMVQGVGNDYTVTGQTITWLRGSGTAPTMKTSHVLAATYVSA